MGEFRVRALGIFVLTLTSLSPVRAQATAVDPLALARFYFPEIIHGEGKSPRYDVPTRVDFDGDFNADNNWENAARMPMPAATYYDVIETRDRYFITYGLFYPRDYDYRCFWWLCHENDFEGMRVTVRKDRVFSTGSVVWLETIAHSNLKRVREPQSLRVVIEGGGHGIHPEGQYPPDRRNRRYRSGDFEFRSMDELWERRGEVGRNRLWIRTYRFDNGRFSIEGVPAAFEGRYWGKGRANPPWGWDVRQFRFRRGEWFLDPIDAHKRFDSFGEFADDEYLVNPYPQVWASDLK